MVTPRAVRLVDQPHDPGAAVHADRSAAPRRQWSSASRSAGRFLTWFVRDTVASDERAAEAAAVAQFDLNEEQRKRLVVRAQD
jgi:hypothetical protein